MRKFNVRWWVTAEFQAKRWDASLYSDAPIRFYVEVGAL